MTESRFVGLSVPHPVVGVEITVFDLERVVEALAFRAGESRSDPSFSRIERELRKVLDMAEKSRRELVRRAG